MFSVLFAMALAAGQGRDPPEMTDLDRAVLAELNWARAHPRDYADELRAYRDDFDGVIAYSNDAPDGLQTREGVAAVDDAIAFLDRQAALPPLDESGVLAGGADDLVIDQGRTGQVGHYSSAGLDPSARVRRHGGGAYVGEIIAYGQPSARGIVRQLIVDDGVPSRGHRTSIYSATYRYAGARCGPHPGYSAVCVVDLSATVDGTIRLSRPAAPQQAD